MRRTWQRLGRSVLQGAPDASGESEGGAEHFRALASRERTRVVCVQVCLLGVVLATGLPHGMSFMTHVHSLRNGRTLFSSPALKPHHNRLKGRLEL